MRYKIRVGKVKLEIIEEKNFPVFRLIKPLTPIPFTRADQLTFKAEDGIIKIANTKQNRKAIEVFRKIQELNGKIIETGSNEDFEYVKLELELMSCGALGRLLARFIAIEYEEEM